MIDEGLSVVKLLAIDRQWTIRSVFSDIYVFAFYSGDFLLTDLSLLE
jgi:hypothetical protein